MFVGICADLERQFEFVQQGWINDPGFLALRDEPDPIVGAQTRAKAPLHHPDALGPICFDGLKAFVEPKGGGYFFAPSFSALVFLAEMSGLPPEGAER